MVKDHALNEIKDHALLYYEITEKYDNNVNFPWDTAIKEMLIVLSSLRKVNTKLKEVDLLKTLLCLEISEEIRAKVELLKAIKMRDS